MSRHASTTLASFISAAESGSFAAAAKVLGISAAAVGQNVKRMEDAFGVKLFARTTRKMALTPEGVLLLQRARGPLRELDEIDTIFDESRGVVSGVLRVTAPRFFAKKTLVPLLGKFTALHPGVEVDLDASDSVRDFVDDGVDVAFRWSEPAESSMIARKISDLPMVTLAAPSYLERFGAPQHPEDLADHNCIQFRFPHSREIWVWAFEIEGELRRVRTRGTLTANDGESLLAAAVGGQGLIQSDTFMAYDEIRRGDLIPVMSDYSPTMKSLQICYPTRNNLPLRVRAFIDFVLEAIPKNAFCMRSVCDRSVGADALPFGSKGASDPPENRTASPKRPVRAVNGD